MDADDNLDDWWMNLGEQQVTENILLHGTWEGNSAQTALEFTLKFLLAEKNVVILQWIY